MTVDIRNKVLMCEGLDKWYITYKWFVFWVGEDIFSILNTGTYVHFFILFSAEFPSKFSGAFGSQLEY